MYGVAAGYCLAEYVRIIVCFVWVGLGGEVMLATPFGLICVGIKPKETLAGLAGLSERRKYEC